MVTDDDFHSSGGVESCEGSFSLTVEYVNHAPTFENSHANWACFVYTDTNYILPEIEDIDVLDTLTRTITLDSGSALPSFLTYDTVAETILCSTSDNNDSGIYTIKVKAADNNSQSAS